MNNSNNIDTLTYEWEITGLRKSNSENLSDVIIGTNWKVVGTDATDGVSGTFNGATPFKISEVDPNNFTPFHELTQEQVLGWIQNSVSSSALGYWGHITERISKEINSSRYSVATVATNDLPWSPTSGSTTPLTADTPPV
jgi:hypothetical protein